VRFAQHKDPSWALGSGGGKARLRQQAYTFIEIMVAGGLLGFMVFSVYTAFSYGFTTIALSQENLRADQVLVQKLETLRVHDWSQVNSGYIPTNFTSSFSTNGGVAQGATYTGTVSITSMPLTESYSNTLRQVTVTLAWTSGGVPRTRSMSTLVSQHGIQTYKP